MVFHNLHVETRGWHVDSTQASFLRAVQRRDFFPFVILLTWGVTVSRGPSRNDVECKVYDVSFIVDDVELALRGNVWFRGRRLWHENVMWDILLDGGIYLWEFLGWRIVLFDNLCDSRMFRVTSYWTLQIIRMCCEQKHSRFVHVSIVFQMSPPCRGWLPEPLKHNIDIKLVGC